MKVIDDIAVGAPMCTEQAVQEIGNKNGLKSRVIV